MSIQGEIDRLKTNVSAAYDAVEEMGGSLPEEPNSDNLAGAVMSIPKMQGIPVTPITEAEYAALPDSQKNSETAWLVTDADAESGGGDSGGTLPGGGTTGQVLAKASNADGDVKWTNLGGEIYSTEESIAGTFAGNLIYQRIFNITTGSSSGQNVVTSDKPLANCTIVSVDGYCVDSNLNNIPVYFKGANNDHFSVFFYQGNIYTNVSGTSLINKQATITVKYIKVAGITFIEKEEEIGTFLGKPLYRRVFNLTTGSTDGQQQITTNTPLNGCSVVAIDKYLVDKYNSNIPTFYCTSGGTVFTAFIKQGDIYFYIEDSAFLKRPAKIFVEYTKTTD